MKILCILINIIGGLSVLASYAYGIIRHQNSIATLWGGVPEYLRPCYGVGMIAATLGYLLCSYFVIFEINSAGARIFNYWGYGVFAFIYALVLLPSILWMPLTFQMNVTPTPLTWFILRAILFLVAFGALLLVMALVGLNKNSATWIYKLALIGSILFFLHTFVLDALLWPYFFKK